jgi:hypothetical protein
MQAGIAPTAYIGCSMISHWAIGIFKVFDSVISPHYSTIIIVCNFLQLLLPWRPGFASAPFVMCEAERIIVTTKAFSLKIPKSVPSSASFSLSI